MSFTDPTTQSIFRDLQADFDALGDKLAMVFARHSISTSARRMNDEDFSLFHHGQVGTAVASLNMTVAALSPDDEGGEFPECDAGTFYADLALGIAGAVVAARRMGIDLLPLIGAGIAVHAALPNTPDRVDAAAQTFSEFETVAVSLYDDHSTMSDDAFRPDGIITGFNDTFGADDEDDEDTDAEAADDEDDV